jgi:phosphatidate phosphatase APP1
MIKELLHSAAWRIEAFVDRLRGQRDPRRIIEPYIGYAEPDALVVRGRVLASLRRNSAAPLQSKWLNFRQMMSLFLTDEVAGVQVEAMGVKGMTDEEGYFTLRIPRSHASGWQDVIVTLSDQQVEADCSVLVPQANARFGVISDIDDTMLHTGAYALWRNLWTSLTGNALTRRVFPDAVHFMNALGEAGRNPVYYVSSSPWNLHHFLTLVFARAGLLRGPMFLRDLGLSPSQFVTGTHGDHKGGAIDLLMQANPELDFVLVGDTGQHDAFVYRDAVRRHPGRVIAIVLREPGPGPDSESCAAMEEIRSAGINVYNAPDFEAIAPQILQQIA